MTHPPIPDPSTASAVTPLKHSPQPLGFAGGAEDESDQAAKKAQIAQQILEDPVALQQLSQRVFELLQEDLKQQRERSRGYGRSL